MTNQTAAQAMANIQILDNLRILDSLYQKYIDSRDYEAAEEYSQQVYLLTEMSMAATDYRVHATLAQHWVNRLSVFGSYRRVDVYSTESIKRTLGLLSYPGATEKTLSIPDNRLVVAYMCLRMTHESINSSMRLANPDARHVIDIWTGTSISTQDILSIETVTGILYGPVVWDLYRQEVETDYQWPSFLLKQTIPTTMPASAHKYTAENSPIELPTDI